MTLLLDTHAFLWWLYADKRLSKKASAALRDPDNQVLVSSATAWEIAIKHRLRKLDSAAPLVADYGRWVARAGFGELAITSAHAIKAGGWDSEHRDPFDRMLAAQSALEDLRLVTRDPVFADFGIDTFW